MSPVPNTPFSLDTHTVGIGRDGAAILIEQVPGPPKRIDGLSVGRAPVHGPGPHGGERHPDGDEVLILLSGRVEVRLEEEGGDRTVELLPGQAFVVPKGVWHRVVSEEPSELVFVTPGPRGDHRPLESDT